MVKRTTQDFIDYYKVIRSNHRVISADSTIKAYNQFCRDIKSHECFKILDNDSIVEYIQQHPKMSTKQVLETLSTLYYDCKNVVVYTNGKKVEFWKKDELYMYVDKMGKTKFHNFCSRLSTAYNTICNNAIIPEDLHEYWSFCVEITNDGEYLKFNNILKC